MEIAEMHVGKRSSEARFAVSTVAEIEFMVPMFQRLRKDGRGVNVLYAVPLPPSQTRLARLARQLGSGSISVIIDSVSQISLLQSFYEETGFPGWRISKG